MIPDIIKDKIYWYIWKQKQKKKCNEYKEVKEIRKWNGWRKCYRNMEYEGYLNLMDEDRWESYRKTIKN